MAVDRHHDNRIAPRARIRSDRGEVASWLIFMAGLVAAAVLAVSAWSLLVEDLTDEVVDSAGGSGENAPGGGDPGGGDPGSGDPGSGDPGSGDPGRPGGDGDPDNTPADVDADPLPVETLHCSLTVGGELAALLRGAGQVSTGFLIHTMPDGTRLVVFEGDAAGDVGFGGIAGLGVTVNDSVLGAYANGSAEALGGGGVGIEYEVPPDQSLAGFFGSLLASPVTSPANSVDEFFETDYVPDPPTPSKVYVDADGYAQAGGTAGVGIGIASATADAGGSVHINESYALLTSGDGGFSHTTTITGELGGGAGGNLGIPGLNTGAQLDGQAIGSVAVETIYDASGTPQTMVVTTTYGIDGTAGQSDGVIEITTDQYVLDLTNQDVLDAVNSVDFAVPGGAGVAGGLPNQLPQDAVQVLADHAQHADSQTQDFSESGLDIDAVVGLGIGASAGIDGNCTQLK